MAYGNDSFRRFALQKARSGVPTSPPSQLGLGFLSHPSLMGNSISPEQIRQNQAFRGRGPSMFGQLTSQPRPANPAAAAGSEFTRTGGITRENPDTANFSKFSNGEIDYSRRLSQPTNYDPSMNTSGPAEHQWQIGAALKARSQPTNPFEGNDQYQAFMDFQQSLAPSQEQRTRLQELQSAFEGTGGYKDYRINQLQNQLQQRQRNPMMGMGLGGMRPMGMQPYQGFGRPQQFSMQQPMRQPMPMQQPMRQFGAMGYNQPQQNPYQQQQYGMMGGYQQNPYQQQRPQPPQFGGYGMGQSMGGYGGYGGMSNPYQPQQMGSYNPNNSMGYLQ